MTAVFKARYKGKCPRCGRRIGVGSLIAKAFDIGAIVHKDCMYPPRPVDTDLDPGLAGGFTIGVTGSTYLGKQPVPALKTWLAGLDADAFVTVGWGTGVDREAGRYLSNKRRTTAEHFVVVPYEHVVDWWSVRQGEVHTLQGGTLRDSNEALVMLADHLVAIVKGPSIEAHPEDVGAWDAVRQARELEVPVTLMQLGDYKHWNHTRHPAFRYRQPVVLPEVVRDLKDAEDVEDKEYF